VRDYKRHLKAATKARQRTAIAEAGERVGERLVPARGQPLAVLRGQALGGPARAGGAPVEPGERREQQEDDRRGAEFRARGAAVARVR
jgi:hypothetical protein